MSRIRPINNYVIVALDPSEEKTSSGLFIPEKYKMPKKTGTVKAVGRGLVTAGGQIVPPQVRAGDRVYIVDLPMTSKQIEYEGQVCVLLPDETMIIGIVTEEGPEAAAPIQ